MFRTRFQHLALLGVGLAVALGGAALLVERSGVPPASGASLSEPFQLTKDQGNHLRPAWSPDGQKIAFHSNSSGSNHIWVINTDGTGLKQLTDGTGDDRRPAWSPDGARITFDSDRAGSRDIWVMNADGAGLRQLTNVPAEEFFPSWSPDGSKIAYYSYSDGAMDIWASGLREAVQQRLTTNLATIQNSNCTFGCHAVSWSGDSSRIAYTGADHKSVWVMDADGSSQRSLTEHGRIGHYHFPAWREDGQLILVSEELGEKVWSDIWTVKADGSALSQLYSRIEHGGPFAWSPDGSRVAFHSPRTGLFQIYIAELSTPGVGRLPGFTGARAIQAAPSPAGLLWILVVPLALAGFLGWRVRRAWLRRAGKEQG